MTDAKVTQFKYVEAPMNLGMADRVALLNIVVRDMQAGGASIHSVLADGDGWRIEYMGVPADISEVFSDEQS